MSRYIHEGPAHLLGGEEGEEGRGGEEGEEGGGGERRKGSRVRGEV